MPIFNIKKKYPHQRKLNQKIKQIGGKTYIITASFNVDINRDLVKSIIRLIDSTAKRTRHSVEKQRQ